MASQAASGGTHTGSPAVAVVVGEEELLVERAVARLVAAASAATGPAGAGEGPFPARSGVHEVSGGALGHGDLAMTQFVGLRLTRRERAIVNGTDRLALFRGQQIEDRTADGSSASGRESVGSRTGHEIQIRESSRSGTLCVTARRRSLVTVSKRRSLSCRRCSIALRAVISCALKSTA